MGLCFFGHFNFSESLFLLDVLPVQAVEEVANGSDEASDCSIPATKNFNSNLIGAVKLFHNKMVVTVFETEENKVCLG